MASREHERSADGRFSEKATERVAGSGRFAKGHKKLGGRPKGGLNKTTRAVREFLAELCDDPEVQQAVRESIVEKRDTPAFFRALDQVIGKAKETVDVSLTGNVEHWLKEAREAARRGKS
jgi:hypothetical protein